MPQFTVTNFTGTQNFGPINVPQGISNALFSMDATNMTNPAMQGSLQMDLSLDNGVTWASTSRTVDTNPFPVLMTFAGGAKTKTGQPIPEYNIACVFPHPELATRQLRAQLIVSGVPLTSTATLTAA
jgi:hypothetical protein